MAIPVVEPQTRRALPSAPKAQSGEPAVGEVTAEAVSAEDLRNAFGISTGWTIALGVIGSCLLSFISVAVAGALKHDEALEQVHMSWMRFGHGKTIATDLGWLGLCLIVLAWVRAGRLAVAGLVSVRWLARTMAFWVTPLLFAAPLYTRDPYSYLAQGALLRDGHNPYNEGPVMDPGIYTDNVAEVWSTTGSPYGPLFMLVMKTLTTIVGNHVVPGLILTRLVMLPGVALTFWAVTALAKHFNARVEVAIWLAMLNPLMIVNLIGGAHNEMLMVGFLTSGLVLVLRGRQTWGVALIATAMCVKATAVLALPFVGWIWLAQIARQRRESASLFPVKSAALVYAKVVGQVMAIAAGVLASFTLIAGLDLGWSREIFDTLVVVNWLAVPTAVAQLLSATIGSLFGWNDQDVIDVSRQVFTVVMLALLAAFWWWFREPLWEKQEQDDLTPASPTFAAKAEKFLREKFAGDVSRAVGSSALIGVVLAMLVSIELSAAVFPWYFSWPLVVCSVFVTSHAVRAGIVFWSVALLFMFGLDGDQQMYSLPMMLIAFAVSALAALAFWRRTVPASRPDLAVLPLG